MAQAIKESGMEFPEFFNLLTNGAKLEASETKKISFTENQKINSILEKWKSYMKSEVNNYHKKTKIKKKRIIIKSF